MCLSFEEIRGSRKLNERNLGEHMDKKKRFVTKIIKYLEKYFEKISIPIMKEENTKKKKKKRKDGS